MFPWMQANHLMNLGNLSQLLKTGFNTYHLMNISDVFQVRFGLHVTLGGFPMKAGLVERDRRKGKTKGFPTKFIATPSETEGYETVKHNSKCTQ